MARKKIHFAMIEAGGGHKTPAVAVVEAMEELYPGKYDIKLLDFMRDLGCTDLDEAHKKVWKYALVNKRQTKNVPPHNRRYFFTIAVNGRGKPTKDGIISWRDAECTKKVRVISL